MFVIEILVTYQLWRFRGHKIYPHSPERRVRARPCSSCCTPPSDADRPTRRRRRRATRHDLQHRRGGAPLYLLEPNPEPPAQQPELTLVEEEGEGEEELRRADGGSADVADRGV